ncbi:hypothetical protein SCA6_002814 [Theobroma cacao]
MDKTETFKDNIVPTPQDEAESWDDEFRELKRTLPKEEGWYETPLYFFQGFWCSSPALKDVISFQKHFQALDSDIIVASVPKSGTTWLKALTFSIVNRNQFRGEENPLLSSGPHQLVPFLEFDLYLNNPCPDLENSCPYQPRTFSTHLPYASLPPSIKDSNSKIVYICRNPMDVFISLWFFVDKLHFKHLKPLDEAFELFCKGIYGSGPFFDHVLGYWKVSQENPNKILFLQYEDLKEDIIFHVKRMGKFLGFPFSEEEEKQGVVEEIARTCSFGNLKELDVNKNGVHIYGIPHHTFFRKAEVGNWSNYLTPAMVERLEKLIQENLDGSEPHGRDEIDMIFQIHCMEKEDYGSVLRAFFAQSDRLSWGKERLITELRQELNVTDVEHGELLWKIISDESFKMIREWRKSAPYVQDSLAGELNASRSAPSPMGHASEKKRKTSHASDSIFHKQEPHGQASLGFLPFPTPVSRKSDKFIMFSLNSGRSIQVASHDLQAPSDDKGRRIVKSKTKIGYHGPYFEHLKEGADVIQIRETKRLLHEDHERSLLLALAKLSHVSNDDDSRGEVRENKRQIVTHSRFHLQAGGLDSYPPESYPPKKSCTLKSYDPTHPVKLKVPRP